LFLKDFNVLILKIKKFKKYFDVFEIKKKTSTTITNTNYFLFEKNIKLIFFKYF